MIEYSEAQMIAPDEVLVRASAVNQALNRVDRPASKRLESGEPEQGETMETADQDRQAVWDLLRAMRAAMRHDLGVSHGGSPGRPGADRDSF